MRKKLLTQDEIENLTWIQAIPEIYQCRETKKYHFRCRDGLLDETAYKSLLECLQAIVCYREKELNELSH